MQLPDLTGTPWRAIILSEKHEAWTLVDAIDYPWLILHRWNLSWGKSCPWKTYAKRNVGPDRATVRMHRAILALVDPVPLEEAIEMHGDHVNGQGLDNRRANLRWATPNREPRQHRGPRAHPVAGGDRGAAAGRCAAGACGNDGAGGDVLAACAGACQRLKISP
jgi:hypothetical protein